MVVFPGWLHTVEMDSVMYHSPGPNMHIHDALTGVHLFHCTCLLGFILSRPAFPTMFI